MRIRELLVQKSQQELKTIKPGDRLLEAADVLATNNIGALPVVEEDNTIVGIVSERDMVRSLVGLQQDIFARTVRDVMIRSVVTCVSDDLMDDVYEIMVEKGFRHIPVVENGKLSGMLSIRDFEFAHKRLRSQALSDDLTGLHNLRHLLHILDGEFNRYRRFRSPLSVIAIKVDKLVDICGEKGHAAGDVVIKTLADILVDVTRTYDSIGRTSDDGFAVVFPNTDSKTAKRACERIMRAVRTHQVAEGDAWTTVSIGLAHADVNVAEGMSILKRAGDRVQMASECGGDCIEAPDSVDAVEETSASTSEDVSPIAVTANRFGTH